MSRDEWGWYKRAAKQPPPARGIKLKKSAVTWWGQRWVQALERMSRAYSNRLPRGRSYARAGRTHDLTVRAGRVTAKVTGSRPTPYRVTVALAQLDDAVWNEAIAAMAAKAQFCAELLAGEMPRDIDAAFGPAGASLFPMKPADLVTACTCPDVANPCKHIAATHYVLGEALDRDPFLLFELRGRSKAQVLEALRAARAGEGGGERAGAREKRDAKRESAPSGEIPLVVLAKLDPSDYDRARSPLPALQFTFEAAPQAISPIEGLGKPAGWASDRSPSELLGPMVRRAAERAREMAMGEGEAGGEAGNGPLSRVTHGVGK